LALRGKLNFQNLEGDLFMENVYDLVIIGAGPAGLSAGLYGARSRMNVLILEKEKSGGQIVTTSDIANYPGSIPDATGPTLIKRMVQQCEEFGAKIEKGTVEEVDLKGKIKKLHLKGGSEVESKSVIIATGAYPRRLNVPGEKEFTGKGVSYCATCDADFFTDMEIYCVGGGDTAVEEALFLTKFASKVTIVHRRDELRAAKSIQEKAFKNEKINFLWNSTIDEIRGDGIVEEMVVKNTKTGEKTVIKAPEEFGTFGIFVFVGYIPNTEIFKGEIELNDKGYIETCQNLKTNIPGVYAAGDIREKSLRQVITAAADGAIAAIQAERHIESIEY
jgi:thioredoxin reductase (NADPH)